MISDRDVTRIVRSWLQEGATSLPDRILDDVMDQLPATPQRRPWWPGRRFWASTVWRIAIVITAVVAVLVAVEHWGLRSTTSPQPL